MRFTVRERALDAMGPRVEGTFTDGQHDPGAVRVAWPAAEDEDNEYPTYRVYLGHDTEARCARPRALEWWWLPTFACVDTMVFRRLGPLPGDRHRRL